MMTMMVISYIVTWINMIYSYWKAPTDVDLWNEEME